MTFAVTFWGTRGSIACPTPRHLSYGGNTSCVHVEADGIGLDAPIPTNNGQPIRGWLAALAAD